jgi:hypothetical protein
VPFRSGDGKFRAPYRRWLSRKRRRELVMVDTFKQLAYRLQYRVAPLTQIVDLLAGVIYCKLQLCEVRLPGLLNGGHKYFASENNLS